MNQRQVEAMVAGLYEAVGVVCAIERELKRDGKRLDATRAGRIADELVELITVVDPETEANT